MRVVVVALFLACLGLSVSSYRLSGGVNDDDSEEETSSNEKFNEIDMFMPHDKKVTQLRSILPGQDLMNIGQVGGLATLKNGKLLVFHRGKRAWSFDSFIWNNKFNPLLGPIKENCIDIIDVGSLEKVKSVGSNRFYMPHGLSVDHEGKVWVTDVGLHQVLKFDLDNFDEPELVIGEKLVPGQDESHFCKPTDVAVSEQTGDIFVSDGYCNQRIVQFDKNGKYVKQFKDEKAPLVVSHSIALIEKLGLVCGVSREQGRIVCFDIESGEPVVQITDKNMATVYAIEYDPVNEVLQAVTGDNASEKPVGLTFSAKKENFGHRLLIWDADKNDLKRAHDIALTRDGSKIFLGQLNGEIDEFSYD